MIVLYFKVYFQHVVTDILYHREQQSPPLSTGSGCRTWSGSGWCEDTVDCWSSFLISELFLLHMMLSRDQTLTTETRDLRTNQKFVIFSLNQSEISSGKFQQIRDQQWKVLTNQRSAMESFNQTEISNGKFQPIWVLSCDISDVPTNLTWVPEKSWSYGLSSSVGHPGAQLPHSLEMYPPLLSTLVAHHG